jgi:hypothetical protein
MRAPRARRNQARRAATESADRGLCAARAQVPASLLSQPTLAFAPETAHTAAFLEANKLLRAARVDDSLSGTTAITCLVRGTTLCVSNVGDSRACLAEDTGRALAAINLSCDQTPFRRETRCARCGAPTGRHQGVALRCAAQRPTRLPAPPPALLARLARATAPQSRTRQTLMTLAHSPAGATSAHACARPARA